MNNNEITFKEVNRGIGSLIIGVLFALLSALLIFLMVSTPASAKWFDPPVYAESEVLVSPFEMSGK